MLCTNLLIFKIMMPILADCPIDIALVIDHSGSIIENAPYMENWVEVNVSICILNILHNINLLQLFYLFS